MARWNTPHGLCASVWALCAREKIVGLIFLNNNNIENVESCVQIFFSERGLYGKLRLEHKHRPREAVAGLAFKDASKALNFSGVLNFFDFLAAWCAGKFLLTPDTLAFALRAFALGACVQTH
jgi:hypothetical protein